jgi:hypothetical protein
VSNTAAQVRAQLLGHCCLIMSEVTFAFTDAGGSNRLCVRTICLAAELDYKLGASQKGRQVLVPTTLKHVIVNTCRLVAHLGLNMPVNDVTSAQGVKLWQMRLIKCGSKLWLLMLRQL